jgi:hypothetical protein
MANAPAQQLPAPTVVSELLTDALVTAGVVGLDESIEPAVINKAFTIANRMIAQWQHERYMVFRLEDVGFLSTGAQTYTVGAGQNYNINPRPDRLEFAFLRQVVNNGSPAPNAGTQPFDWPLEVIDAHEDYAAIRLKTLGTFSSAVFYDPGWPIGWLKPWPIPQAGIYEIHFLYKQVLQQFPNLQATMMFPPEYGAALEWCLARRFKVAFQMPRDPDLNILAAQGKNIIRKANTMIPTLKFPRELTRNSGASYNYRSDSN